MKYFTILLIVLTFTLAGMTQAGSAQSANTSATPTVDEMESSVVDAVKTMEANAPHPAASDAANTSATPIIDEMESSVMDAVNTMEANAPHPAASDAANTSATPTVDGMETSVINAVNSMEANVAGTVGAVEGNTAATEDLMEARALNNAELMARKNAPIRINGTVSPLMSVTFNHSSHAGIVCMTCHHDTTSDIVYACSACHAMPGVRKNSPMSLFMGFHAKHTNRSCYGCHTMKAEENPAAHPGFKGCQPCHTGQTSPVGQVTQ